MTKTNDSIDEIENIVLQVNAEFINLRSDPDIKLSILADRWVNDMNDLLLIVYNLREKEKTNDLQHGGLDENK